MKKIGFWSVSVLGVALVAGYYVRRRRWKRHVEAVMVNGRLIEDLPEGREQ